MNKRQAVEEAIKKAVPETAGDDTVCVCGHKWDAHKVEPDFASWRFRDYRKDCQHCICRKFAPVLGRPITLEDVLRAMDGEPGGTEGLCIDTLGQLSVLKLTKDMTMARMSGVHKWHLGKPLSDQSDEVVDFLYPILCKEV